MGSKPILAFTLSCTICVEGSRWFVYYKQWICVGVQDYLAVVEWSHLSLQGICISAIAAEVWNLAKMAIVFVNKPRKCFMSFRCMDQNEVVSLNGWVDEPSNKNQVYFLFHFSESLRVFGPTISAAYAACLLTRECNRKAYSKNRRSTTTSDMIECIHDSFELLYE